MPFSHWLFFFFKQKTAYEMRISDWSSDVCSSDLIAVAEILGTVGIGELHRLGQQVPTHQIVLTHRLHVIGFEHAEDAEHGRRARRGRRHAAERVRSEEHTSELQSLTRISYAVSCLTKQKNFYCLKQLLLHL